MVKDFKNTNYWALILGGSSGLGLASAQKLARHGMNICIVHRNRKAEMAKIENEFEKIKAHKVDFISFNLDALNEEKRRQIIEELKRKLGQNGRIRTLIHSIAKGNLKPMHSEEKPILKNDDFLITIDSMAISLYDWAKLILENKLFANDSRIISFTSEGNTKAWKNYAAVSAAKATLEAITRNLALEFAPFGIRTNCIQAGITNTASFRMIPGSGELKEITKTRNPFKRLTKPEDVANVVYLLCKDEAAWINGSIIPVNGGEHIV
jgi:enoyl-[acyl-carrier protein] reductase III